MSVWTHVNAIFRLDSFVGIKDDDLIKVFGRAVAWEELHEVYDENWNLKGGEKYLPMGSEGTLKMCIWHNPDPCCMASTTVSVFGDLRDYSSFDEIELWFNNCCESTHGIWWVRQAVCQVEVEGLGCRVFLCSEEDDI